MTFPFSLPFPTIVGEGSTQLYMCSLFTHCLLFLLHTPSTIPLTPSSSYLLQVFIIKLLLAKKYKEFRPLIDTYCDKLFSAATVHM